MRGLWTTILVDLEAPTVRLCAPRSLGAAHSRERQDTGTGCLRKIEPHCAPQVIVCKAHT